LNGNGQKNKARPVGRSGISGSISNSYHPWYFTLLEKIWNRNYGSVAQKSEYSESGEIFLLLLIYFSFTFCQQISTVRVPACKVSKNM
jgi:hypothetical protein